MQENQNSQDNMDVNSEETENNNEINSIEPEQPENQESLNISENDESPPSAEEIIKSDSMLKTAVVLGVLTFIAALVLSVLNSVTAPVIAERLKSDREEYVKNMFGSEAVTEELQDYEDLYLNYDAQIINILVVWSNSDKETRAGYCVTVSPLGFTGNIDMLVSADADGAVIDTVVLNMSETPGIGTKINEDDFKNQFIGKSLYDVNTVEMTAGATVSAKAFLRGVNAALAVVRDIFAEITEPDYYDGFDENEDYFGEE